MYRCWIKTGRPPCPLFHRILTKSWNTGQCHSTMGRTLCLCPQTSTCQAQWTGWWCGPALASSSCWCWRSGRSARSAAATGVVLLFGTWGIDQGLCLPAGPLAPPDLRGSAALHTWGHCHSHHKHWLVFTFSLLWLRRRYWVHQASTERLRKIFYAQTTWILN